MSVRSLSPHSPPLEFDEQFERQLPPGILAELQRSNHRPRIYLRRPAPLTDRSPGSGVVAGPPAPVLSQRGSGSWLLWWAVLSGVVILLALWPRAPRESTLLARTPPPAQPVEVRRALPVEVRRALPAVPRALLVSRSRFSENSPLPAPYAPSQPVRMPDGTITEARYQGELPNSAALPPQGRFIGEEWSTGNTTWIWMTPAGANFPSWVDP